MSNEQDNKPERTALQQSIQRKKDRINKTMMSEFEKQILEREITEDEKLMEVEKEQRIKDHIAGQLYQTRGDSFTVSISSALIYVKTPWIGRNDRVLIDEIYNEKYGTDGK